MSWPVLRASLDVLLASPLSPLTVEFSGGEPLLEFPLIEQAVRYVERARRNDLQYVLTTNGTLFSSAILAFLDQHRFDVRWSFHAEPQARDGSRRKVFRRLDRLLDFVAASHPALWHDRLYVAVTVGIARLPALADTVHYLAEKGVRHIGVSPAFGETGWRSDEIVEIEREFDRMVRLMRVHRQTTGHVPLMCLRRKQGEKDGLRKGGPRCSGATGQAIAIAPTGQGYGCSMLAGTRPVVARGQSPGPTEPGSLANATPAGMTLNPQSALWAFHLGDVRAPGFVRQLNTYPSVVAHSRVFDRQRAMRSSYARCAQCRYLAECLLCPVSREFGPQSPDRNGAWDFVCAFTRVMLTARDRFPAEPTTWDRVTGRARFLPSSGSFSNLRRACAAKMPAPSDVYPSLRRLHPHLRGFRWRAIAGANT